MGYVEEVKIAARGQWQNILASLGADESYLQLKKDGPCPFCSPGVKKSDRYCFYDAGAGKWKCRKCDGKGAGGDGFNFVARLKGIDNGKAIVLVGNLLGITRSESAPEPQVRAKKTELGRIWEECIDVTEENAAGKYLRKRGLAMPDTIEIGAHPSVDYKYQDDSGEWRSQKAPALVCQIKNAAGKEEGLEIIYLTKEGDKLPVKDAKKLHKLTEKFSDGACIMFDEPTGDLAIGEGPEVSLYIREVTGLPTWSSMNAGMMKKIKVPCTVRRLWIFGDNDKSGTGQESAWDLAEQYKNQCEVRVLIPPKVDHGWDDVRTLTKADLNCPLFRSEDRYPPITALGLPPVEKFEYYYLPEFAQEQVSRIARTLFAPVDYVAMCFFVMLGMIIGTRCAVRPKVLDEWYVVPNLFGALVGAASTMKTPSMLSVFAPLFKLEKRARAKHKEDLKAYKAALNDFKMKEEGLKHSIKAAKGSDEKRRQEDRLKDLQNNEPEPPILKRYSVNSISTQKLLMMLSENPRGLLSWHDELTGILNLWEDPKNANDKVFVLKCWSGLAGHADDTVSRGDNYADPVCLSFFGGIQTEKLQRFILKTIKNGSDGLLARLQLMTFPDEPRNYVFTDLGENKEEKMRVLRALEFLDDCDFVKLGAIEDEKRPYFRFTYEAQQEFEKWFVNLMNVKIPNERQGLVKEHLSKFKSLMPSLALIIHVSDLADAYVQDSEAEDGRRTFSPGAISKEAVDKAIMLCNYLESHARRVYSLSGGDQQMAAQILAEKILDKKIDDGFTHRTIREKGWSDLQDGDLIAAAIDRLVGAQWLIRSETIGRGRPTVKYLINPRVWIKEDDS